MQMTIVGKALNVSEIWREGGIYFCTLATKIVNKKFREYIHPNHPFLTNLQLVTKEHQFWVWNIPFIMPTIAVCACAYGC
jgi:hypothetical protein